MTTDKDQLNHAREWAEDVQRNYFPGQHRAVVAAAHVIASLPDEWVDTSELRYAISAWEFSNISAAEFVDMVRDALPTPPAPRTMAEIEWSDEEHVGLCARSEWNTTVRMMGILDGAMICVGAGMRVARYSLHDLTPLPGTQIDLRPTGVPVTEDTPEPDQPRLEPETTEQGDEPVFDPAYTYRDRDGDECEYLDGQWVPGDTHAKRVARREIGFGLDSPPAEYGPYTRIEEKTDDQ